MMKDNIPYDVPTFKELMNPTIQALHGLGGSARISEIKDQVISQLDLSERSTQALSTAGNRPLLDDRLSWARSYLKKEGFITNSERGVWVLTEKGYQTQKVDSSEVASSVVKHHRLDSSEIETGIDETVNQGERQDKLVEEDAWRQVLIETLKRMSPEGFERLCQRILRESGFIEVKITGRPGDGGIDGHGIIRLAGLISFPVLFQCKRSTGNVGATTVRELHGAMQGRAEKGLILTTGGFTQSARKEASRDGAPSIDLIDGETLIDLLKDLSLGVKSRTIIEVDSEWFQTI